MFSLSIEENVLSCSLASVSEFVVLGDGTSDNDGTSRILNRKTIPTTFLMMFFLCKTVYNEGSEVCSS
jgi:hypothetical protein